MGDRHFRFGIQNGPFEQPEELRSHARMVESLGYDELFTSDHVGGSSVDPFIPLVVAAEATTTLRVGPLVMNNEFHNPVLLARTVISADQMTGGRVVLGMGTGYAADEHDAIGMPLRSPGKRVTRFGESLDVLRQLFDTGRATLFSEHHTIDIDDFAIRPVQDRIPMLIGGHGRRVVGLGARFADIFQFTGLTQDTSGAMSAADFGIEQVQVRADWLAEAAAARDEDIERSALVQICEIGADVPTNDQLSERLKVSAEVPRDSPFVLVGTVDQVVDKIERLRERLGISHYVVRSPEAFAPVVQALRGR